MEIVERSSGYWVVGGVTEGPFLSIREAQKWINEYELVSQLVSQVETTPLQDKLHNIFMEATERWNDREEVKSYLKGIKGRLLMGKKAAVAMNEGIKGKVAFWVVADEPFHDSSEPVAIVLPEKIAFKIVALGFLPEII